MHTVFVTTSYPASPDDPDGHFVQAEARAAAAAGSDVTVIAPGRRPATGTAAGPVHVVGLEDGGCFGWPGALRRLGERPRRALGAARFIAAAHRQLGGMRADRVVAHWLVPSAFPVALAADAPLEVVAHGSDVRLLERLPGRRSVIRALIEREATFRFVSAELKARLERATGLDLPRTVIEPARLDFGAVPPRCEARRRLGLDAHRSLAVVVGRLVPEKRIDHALSLAAARADAVVVVGDGPSRRRLEAAFPWARFVGRAPRSQALAWISAADLLVSASRDEGAPTVIREARALGVAVLAVAAGDLRAWASRDPGIELVEG